MGRSHRNLKFLWRLAPIAALAALGYAVAAGEYTLAQPLALLSVVLAPVLLPRTVLYPGGGEPPADGPGDQGGGGRGPGSDPPKPPDAPRGGIPLPDAEPARLRLRDHDRPPLTPRRARRAPREPTPTPRPDPVPAPRR